MLASKSSGTKVTILIEDNTPGAQTKVIVIPQASPWMMELLTGESGEATAATAITKPTNAAEARPDGQQSPQNRRRATPKPA